METPAAAASSAEAVPAAPASPAYSVKKAPTGRCKCAACKAVITKDAIVVSHAKKNFCLECFPYDLPLDGYDKLDEETRKTIDAHREAHKGQVPEEKKKAKREAKPKSYGAESVKSARCKCYGCAESFKSMETAIGQKTANGMKTRYHIACFPFVVEDVATISDFDKLSADDQEKLRHRVEENKTNPPQPREKEAGKKRVQPKREPKAANKRGRKEPEEKEEKEEKGEKMEKEEKPEEKSEEKKAD